MSSRYSSWRSKPVLALLLLVALNAHAAGPEIQSGTALIIDHEGNRLFERNPTEIRPIASITKLMTAMVVIDADVPLDDRITITEADRDRLRWSRSRLRIDEAKLSRADLLRTALMSSDNRAAAALGRTTFAGGTPAFVAAMNEKAQSLAMHDTQFADASGLDGGNQSTAEDLVRLLNAAARYPLIREITSTGEVDISPHPGRGPLQYRNTNPLTRDERWTVELSKTGYLNEAGRCLVMQAVIEDRRVYAIFLNAQGKLTPIGDANRLRQWLAEAGELKTTSLSARHQ
ncbi:serine hydrolase [Halochromatium roseum]|uniref:serine hydrolase n=1 Tax=Halochromatium roseum TaxID=391920 RepID=UPI0019117C6A|nr:serine hydrolase [Halochromatium roseum]MBK5937691.1 peptidase S11 [Halochromatium roseum]